MCGVMNPYERGGGGVVADRGDTTTESLGIEGEIERGHDIVSHKLMGGLAR